MFSIHDNCIFRLCILGNKLVLFGLTFIQIEDCRLMIWQGKQIIFGILFPPIFTILILLVR